MGKHLAKHKATEQAVDAELLEATGDDPILAASTALTEAEVATSPKEVEKWQRAAERMEALAEIRQTMPFAAGGAAGARVATAMELHERIAVPSAQEALARENAVLEARRGAQVERRRAEIDQSRDRITRLPIEFQRRVGLLARIDHRAVAGVTAGGIPVAGGGAGLAEAEIVACELAVDVVRLCVTHEKVESVISAIKGVPSDLRAEIVEEAVGREACSWPMEDMKLLLKGLRLASAFLADPGSVVLRDNPGRVKHEIADRVADKGLAAMGALPLALAESTDRTTAMDRRLAAVRAAETPALLAMPEQPTSEEGA